MWERLKKKERKKIPFFFPWDDSRFLVSMIKRHGLTGITSSAGYRYRKETHPPQLTNPPFGLSLMISDAICTQLCARRAPGLPYIYHHSQRVMIQASQGEEEEESGKGQTSMTCSSAVTVTYTHIEKVLTFGFGWHWGQSADLVTCFSQIL